MADIICFSDINKRNRNEDCCLAFNLQLPCGKNKPVVTILMLADGMGGHAHGDIFARNTIDTMSAHLTRRILAPAILPIHNIKSENETVYLDEKILYDCLIETNRHIRDSMFEKHGTKGGTTLAVLVAIKENYWYITLGDSLIYHWTAHKKHLQQISDDHSVTGLLLKNGKISYEEAHLHSMRHYLSYFIGMEEIPAHEVLQNTGSGLLEPEDIIMLCSDGICGNLTVQNS